MVDPLSPEPKAALVPTPATTIDEIDEGRLFRGDWDRCPDLRRD